MEEDEMQQLIADYALNMLDENGRTQVHRLLQTDPQARTLLSELQTVVDSLNLSVEPVELPSGSLTRLRQKAGINPNGAEVRKVSYLQPVPTLPTREVISPTPPQPSRHKFLPARINWQSWAAAAVLALATLAAGWLWLDARSQQSMLASRNQELTALLAAPKLKLTELKPPTGETQATLRLYTDPATDKAYLVAQNLVALPSDKEYEVWFLTSDSQPHMAGLLGTGGNNGPAIFALATNGQLPQYQKVAITIERQHGVEKPSMSPILTGTI